MIYNQIVTWTAFAILAMFVGVVEFSNSTLMFMSNWKHIWRIIKQTIAAFDNSKRGLERKYEF